MLSSVNKEEVLDSFIELKKCKVSNDRINYKYKGKILVLQFSKTTGNGYINGKYLERQVNTKQWVKIKDYTETELKFLLANVIKSFDQYL